MSFMSSSQGKIHQTRKKSSIPKTVADESGSVPTKDSMSAAEAPQSASKDQPLLQAIKDLETTLTSKFDVSLNRLESNFLEKLDGICASMNKLSTELSDCTERITKTEARISDTEDVMSSLQKKVCVLEEKNRVLADTVTDLENQARRSNIRLVDLPENAEGENACDFLEKWLPQALNMPPNTKLVLERAHRIGPRRDPGANPRTLIMKFLNDRDKVAVMRAARDQRRIRYKDHDVRLYPDFAPGVVQQRKKFDSIRAKLREAGIKHGLMFPTKLRLTYEGKTYTFSSAQEAETFYEVRLVQGTTGDD